MLTLSCRAPSRRSYRSREVDDCDVVHECVMQINTRHSLISGNIETRKVRSLVTLQHECGARPGVAIADVMPWRTLVNTHGQRNPGKLKKATGNALAFSSVTGGEMA